MSDAVTVAALAPAGMVSLRGALDDPALVACVTGLTGAAMPAPLTIASGPQGQVAWMSPDELLLFVADAAAAVAAIGQALAGRHHLAADVSDMRSVYALAGPGARGVLAKVVPVDLHPAVFVPGTFRRTRVGQVAGAVWLEADGQFRVIAFRSVGDYVAALLRQSAEDGTVGLWQG
jgi:sarcosine oxidase subunit gamma